MMWLQLVVIASLCRLDRINVVSLTLLFCQRLLLCTVVHGLITHADDSRVGIAIIRLCDSVCDSVCLSVCLSVRTIKPKQLKLK